MNSKILLAAATALSMTAAVPALAQQSAAPQGQQQNQGQQNHGQQPNAASGQSQAQPTNQAANPSKDEIRQAQRALNDKGFKAGRADGMMGPQTKQALRNFQSKQKLKSSGQLDGATMAALGMNAGANGSNSGPPSTVGRSGNTAKSAPSNNPPSHTQGQSQQNH
jgi:peptidoglycan hydrolase-like protein with peptidoglycan-binding domain